MNSPNDPINLMRLEDFYGLAAAQIESDLAVVESDIATIARKASK
jgi:hypothetical protein